MKEELEKVREISERLAQEAMKIMSVIPPMSKELAELYEQATNHLRQMAADREKNKEILRSIRGEVLEDQIDTETQINLFLTDYFAQKEKEEEFLLQFLMDSYCSFGLKVKVLTNIGMDKTVVGKLHGIAELRNVLAHGMPHPFTARKLYDGKKQEFTPFKDIHQKYKEVSDTLKKQLEEEFKRMKTAPKKTVEF